jgi:hypothetical protein
MAGDIGVNEQIILIPTTSRAAAAPLAETAKDQGAHVVHQYGPRVMIGEIPKHRERKIRAAVPKAKVTGAPQRLPAAAIEGLDAIGALGLAAFKLRQSPKYIAAKKRRPHQNKKWDARGVLPPDPPHEHRELTQAPKAARGAAALAAVGGTSQRMTGRIAVGIVIVSGPTAALQFSAAERQKVVAEVQNGLGWHAAQNPAANITWIYDIHSVSVNVQPGGAGDKEALWRDPAMISLGYSGNWQGMVDYVNHIKTQYGTDWTYVAYFTKYPLDWFAYASIGGPRLVMQYDNDGWGPDNIDRVFAHETGHVFQAPDEYSASNCNCAGSWGVYNKPNGNCQLCAPAGGVDCIMRSNSWAYCNWTPWHYGFPWPNGFRINNVDSTPVALAATVFNNKLYAVWKANDPSNRIYFSGSSDGQTWPNGVRINNADSTPASPAACVFNNKLYLSWKANDSSNRIYFSPSTNGTSWPNGVQINSADSTPTAPAACVFNNKLYLFWKANDSSNRIYFSPSTNGTSWPNGVRINNADSTPAAPAACVFNNKLYLFWKANDASNAIYWSRSTNGTSWPNGVKINGADSTPAALAACVLNNKLYLFWRANDSSKRIYFSASSDGQTWPAGKQVNTFDSTPTSVAAAPFQNNAYLFWKANDPSNRIYYTV